MSTREELSGQTPGIKVVGSRRPSSGGLERAAGFLQMVVSLRRGKAFIPRGIHRFESFEESQQWSLRMMARPSNPDPRSSTTSPTSAAR